MTMRLGTLLPALALVGAGLAAPGSSDIGGVAAHISHAANTNVGGGRPLPTYLSLDDGVEQLVTVTSDRWSSTRARMSAWRKVAGQWERVHGPVRVRLGYNGWVPAGKRQQNTGKTPAGSFAMKYVFGNRADPGTAMRYTAVDGDDVWPYEPRDAATYNIYQPSQASTSHWRSDFKERLASYDDEYAYAVVLGFNLPHGVHWSTKRQQYVAREPADTSRGGGIFLHVQRSQYTAGCVAGPIDDIRWTVRWLDPARKPRIVMGPTDWVKRTF
jgi:L,D-peptidoglycan transpeptidase YkuD (ErfK/YbiS/YcfS/YnhG family)